MGDCDRQQCIALGTLISKQTLNLPVLACTCGHTLCKQQRLEYAELLRLHREKKADHQRGIGVDIAASGSLHRGWVLGNALLTGYNAVGVHAWGLHLAHRPELPQGDILIWPGE